MRERNEANPANLTKGNTMYKGIVSGSVENGFYAIIVRIDRDGKENVIYGYEGRHFKTRAAGEKSTAKYIKKHNLRERN